MDYGERGEIICCDCSRPYNGVELGVPVLDLCTQCSVARLHKQFKTIESLERQLAERDDLIAELDGEDLLEAFNRRGQFLADAHIKLAERDAEVERLRAKVQDLYESRSDIDIWDKLWEIKEFLANPTPKETPQ